MNAKKKNHEKMVNELRPEELISICGGEYKVVVCDGKLIIVKTKECSSNLII
jgi:hypothetical protein